MSQSTRNQRELPPNPPTYPAHGHAPHPSYGNPQGSAGYHDDSYDDGGAPRHSGSKTRPVHEVRFGRVCAAIWENRTEQGGVLYNVTVVRKYKVDDQWRESQSFGRDELPLVIKTLDQCHTWIFSQRPQQANRA